ncbi:hypothetical protein VSU19_17440 [Verrucomicrobiales bacterium BCK34]|nr:hypothetical protein [Verrucomicrobiales bacterium BCK34]
MKSMWIWIGCVGLFLVALVTVVSRVAKPEPKVVLWSDLQYGDASDRSKIRVTEELLKDTIIPEIDFTDELFQDCVDVIGRAINENVSGSEALRIVLEDSVSAVNVPIKLKLANVPAAEGLRYLTALAELKYRVTNEGDVEIVSLRDKDLFEEGWFKPGSSFFLGDGDVIEEKVDVRELLEVAGIDFSVGSVAEYYPKKGLMWVRNTREQLEIIDAYISSTCYLPAPTWRDRVYDYWILLTEGYPPAPSSSPVSAPLAPDPFAGGRSSGGGEPDPFGGGGTLRSVEPGPFK